MHAPPHAYVHVCKARAPVLSRARSGDEKLLILTIPYLINYFLGKVFSISKAQHDYTGAKLRILMILYLNNEICMHSIISLTAGAYTFYSLAHMKWPYKTSQAN